MNIQIEPDINRSGVDFTPSQDKILFDCRLCVIRTRSDRII